MKNYGRNLRWWKKSQRFCLLIVSGLPEPPFLAGAEAVFLVRLRLLLLLLLLLYFKYFILRDPKYDYDYDDCDNDYD